MSAAGPSRPASRFAPSPTGYLHKGHAFSALSAAALAESLGGRFVLRIEDIDTERRHPAFEAAILEDLAWLGLDWETPVRRQSEHLDAYQDALTRLRDQGLVYRCFKTRREILDASASAPHGPAVPYRGAPPASHDEARRLEAGEPYAWRLSLDAAREQLGPAWDDLEFTELGTGASGQTGAIRARPESAGDVILARKGLGVAYHLAVVVDDALQGISHVSRGEDLFEATHIQRLLQALLDLPTPVYRHHPLVLGPDGKRLAKRDHAQALREIRASGVSPQALRAELGI
ncbi:MAG: tRNA glutamyl-Q(34) synthetase GluQRS [Caulobacteraceae bacterium]|nr:tRNA glutamyl-Q(34) synthetase GluQRS [Caulobacteraceae bacterium]